MLPPAKLFVRVISASAGRLDGIIVEMEIRAGRKNPYFVRFPKTDASGCAELTRADFVGQFEDHWEEGLMDYDGSVESALPTVEVRLFDPTWSRANRRLALAWPLLKNERLKWSSREEEYEDRVSCRNLEFSAEPISVDLERARVVELTVARRDAE
jgi:hypothetical protein